MHLVSVALHLSKIWTTNKGDEKYREALRSGVIKKKLQELAGLRK